MLYDNNTRSSKLSLIINCDKQEDTWGKCYFVILIPLILLSLEFLSSSIQDIITQC